jgi:hypothetical protein
MHVDDVASFAALGARGPPRTTLCYLATSKINGPCSQWKAEVKRWKLAAQQDGLTKLSGRRGGVSLDVPRHYRGFARAVGAFDPAHRPHFLVTVVLVESEPDSGVRRPCSLVVAALGLRESGVMSDV